ncbi:hypothetical protein D3C81_1912040 [compost metagenome]
MPVVGQFDLAVAAQEQFQTIEGFQGLNLAADRRLRHAEFLRCQLEAAMTSGGFEGA